MKYYKSDKPCQGKWYKVLQPKGCENQTADGFVGLAVSSSNGFTRLVGKNGVWVEVQLKMGGFIEVDETAYDDCVEYHKVQSGHGFDDE